MNAYPSWHTRLYFDGAITMNPGGDASCSYVLWGGDGDMLDSGSHWLGRGEGWTNNVAEYMGLIHGLRAAVSLRVTHIEAIGDSKLVINQMRGEWGCRARLRALHREAAELASRFTAVAFAWVPRERNLVADRLGRYRAASLTLQQQAGALPVIMTLSQYPRWSWIRSAEAGLSALWRRSTAGSSSDST